MQPLTETLRYRWECNGYLVLPGTLSPGEVREVNAAVDRHFHEFRIEYKERAPGTYQHASMLEGSDGFDDLIWHPNVIDIVDGLLGGDATFVETSVILKDGRTPTHAGWHRDLGYGQVFHPLSTVGISVIYYLSDVAPEGGPFAVVPGSHKFTFPLPKLEGLDEMHHFERLAAPAGTAILFHGALWHAAMPNNSDVQRRTVHNYYLHRWMKTTGHTKIPGRLYETVAGDAFRERLLYKP